MGYSYGWADPSHFGLDLNGNVVMLDFAHAEKEYCAGCGSGGSSREPCVRLDGLKRQLFKGDTPPELEDGGVGSDEERGVNEKRLAGDGEDGPGEEQGGTYQNKRRKLAKSKNLTSTGAEGNETTFDTRDWTPTVTGLPVVFEQVDV